MNQNGVRDLVPPLQFAVAALGLLQRIEELANRAIRIGVRGDTHTHSVEARNIVSQLFHPLFKNRAASV